MIVLANSDDSDSLRLARHYMAARKVPAANLVALKLSTAEAITWREFITTLWAPLTERLIRDRWLDAIAMDLTDAVGRRKYAPNGHRIAALVVCRGVPLKIEHDPALVSEARPFTSRAELRTNSGAVDSELSLLPAPSYNINAFVQNPLFQNSEPAEMARNIVRVSRLDGPTVADAMALVDRALQAERTGLLGRAYLDYAAVYQTGNDWLQTAARQLRDLNFDIAEDREGGTMPAMARADAPVLYFGWYTGDLDGPFRLPGFRFPPGAIALHIHSYSASTLRSTSSGWAGPLVARGVTATVGNVYEPYLEFTHRPDLLLRALARGWTLAEAAYFALPSLSWQTVLIGDPLYRPFAVPLERQMEKRAELPPQLAGYAIVRRMNELEAARKPDEARALALRIQREAPSLVVGLALAQRLRDAGEKEHAATALGFAAGLRDFATDEWGLAATAARLLSDCGRPARAVELWQTLLAIATLPPELRLAWLRDAQEAARLAGDLTLAHRWAAENAELTMPEKK
ncbi:MAG TPA: TIGR03790 family protein [Opitutaceae bacterium]